MLQHDKQNIHFNRQHKKKECFQDTHSLEIKQTCLFPSASSASNWGNSLRPRWDFLLRHNKSRTGRMLQQASIPSINWHSRSTFLLFDLETINSAFCKKKWDKLVKVFDLQKSLMHHAVVSKHFHDPMKQHQMCIDVGSDSIPTKTDKRFPQTSKEGAESEPQSQTLW